MGWMYTLFFVLLGIAAAVWGGWLERVGPRKAGFVSAMCWCGGLFLGAIGVFVRHPMIAGLGYTFAIEGFLARVPQFEDAYVTLAKIHFKNNRPREGIAVLERLLQRSGFRRIVTLTRDLYAENLRRLLGRGESNAQANIKTAFGEHTVLGAVRRLVNRLFMHVQLGDKLIALAQK
jgi:hypothetical protein